MALSTPTISEINATIIAQLEAELSQTIPTLPKAFIRVLSKVLAGVFVLIYKYAGFMFLQLFVRTATADATVINGVTVRPLIEWGRLIGLGDPVAATVAELTITVTVTTQAGTLPSGTPMLNSDNGVTYITIGAVLLDAATKTVTIRAADDQTGGGGAGAIGNLLVGAVVSFTSPLANVAQDAEVTAVTITAADGEAIEDYRQRVMDRFAKRPQGGAYADYESWGEEVAGIVNVYPYRSVNPGQVDLYVEATVASSGDPDGIPTAPQLQAVLDAVGMPTPAQIAETPPNYNAVVPSRRPVGALVNAFAITRKEFDVEVVDLEVDDVATVQTQIVAACTEHFLDREPFLLGLTVPPRRDRITPAALSGVISDVVNVAGGVFGSVIIRDGATVIQAYTLAEGEKAKVGTVSFT